MQTVQAASRVKDTVFSCLFRRNAYRRDRNKAVVVLAGNILYILWHLVMNRDWYDELGPNRTVKLPARSMIPKTSIDEAVAVLLNAGARIV